VAVNQGVGIDKIAMSFPVAGFSLHESAWATQRISNPGTPLSAITLQTSVNVEGGGKVFVGVQEVKERGTWVGKVEFNPARIHDPEGHGLADSEQVISASEAVCKAASELLAPAIPLDEWRVKRLDVARDFEVENAGFYVQGLAPIKRPYARRNGVWNSPEKGNAQTLMVGSGAGMCRLYDKLAEIASRSAGRTSECRTAPPAAGSSVASAAENGGLLRWEVEARSRWLERISGVKRLNHLNDRSVEVLANERWEWSRMGVEVSAKERVVEKVLRSDMTPAEMTGFIGFLTLLSCGVSVPRDAKTLRKYNRLMKEMNVVIQPDSFGDAFVGRLDFESGREVLRVA
jgi:hypothetical protein